MNKYKDLTQTEAFQEVSKLNSLIGFKFCNNQISEIVRITKLELDQNSSDEHLSNLIDEKLKIAKSNIIANLKELTENNE